VVQLPQAFGLGLDRLLHEHIQLVRVGGLEEEVLVSERFELLLLHQALQ